MANTYTQLFVHIVFAVRNRTSLIDASWRDRLYSYIGGTLTKIGCTPLAIGGVSDHVHILVIQNKVLSMAKIVQEIKSGSSNWINHNRFVKCHFEWQDGYCALSVSPSIVGPTKEYIQNQERHHQTNKTYRDEVRNMLIKYGIEYDEKYLPDNPIDVD